MKNNELEISYENFVSILMKNPLEIYETLDEEKIDVLHAAVGVSGEAGELLDGVKKWVVYNKELDRQNIVEELGDLTFYMQALMNRLEITREEILESNVGKLLVRYEGLKYSDEAAQGRADKNSNN